MRARGFLMTDRKRFEAAGMLPKNLPEFLHGYAFEGELFFMDQISSYYRRHLLIHEGTHLFNSLLLKLSTDQWYAEGIAEMFGTHIWNDEKLQTCVYPKSLAAFPTWGRIELLSRAHREGNARNLAGIKSRQSKAFTQNESYA